MRKQKGFTLIELLIVVAIIGIIAAIAIPNLLNAINRGRQKRTMADMRSIATALESYSVDFNFYPKVAATKINSWQTYLAPTYIKRLPTTDGWNQDLVVRRGCYGHGVHDLLAGQGRGGDGPGRYGPHDRLRDCNRVLQRPVLRLAGRHADQLTSLSCCTPKGDPASPFFLPPLRAGDRRGRAIHARLPIMGAQRLAVFAALAGVAAGWCATSAAGFAPLLWAALLVAILALSSRRAPAAGTRLAARGRRRSCPELDRRR